MAKLFRIFAQKVAAYSGAPATFAFAVAIVVLWASSGPHFNYSDTWQLVINTGTTVITFLMVFLIQNTQNRDSKEIHLKLDGLIRANRHAMNNLIDLEKLSDKDLEQLHAELCRQKESTESRIEEVKQKRKKLRS